MRNNFSDLENIIYTKIKYGLTDKFKDEYPDLDVGTSNINESDETFPYVYVHLLPSSETNTDLEMNIVNDIVATFQIEVTDNENQRNTSRVASEVVNIMKKMSFIATQMPCNDNLKNYRSICRFRRTISANDVI